MCDGKGWINPYASHKVPPDGEHVDVCIENLKDHSCFPIPAYLSGGIWHNAATGALLELPDTQRVIAWRPFTA
jgi:hypothetical protein